MTGHQGRAIREPIWAVVPSKGHARGKSRLRSILADEERARFAREMLETTLGVLSASELFTGIVVATDCDEVEQLANARRAAVCRDAGERSLAEVVDAALADAARRGARAALVVMADLPRIAVDDVRQVAASMAAHDIVIVRDHLGCHTNALGLAPPNAIRTCFGQPESFAAHFAAARAAGLRLAIVDNERIAFDVDEPADLAKLGLRRP